MKTHLVLATLLLSLNLPLKAQDASETQPTLALEDCRIRAGAGFPGIKARCGILERPENPADPNSALLELFVAVVPALSLEPDPDPLVPIAGGPGQASTEFYASAANSFEAIRRTRDIVLLDQRGTGRSAPMICLADLEAETGPYSEARTLALTEDCLAELPHDPRYFTTSVAVQDLEALRIALGYTQLNLYGISYGSRVAQHYLRRYPDTTRTVILDGVVPPQLALGPAIAIEAQETLDAIFDRCAESPACNESFATIRSDFSVLIERLTEEPVTVTLPNPATGKTEELEFSNDEMAGALRLLSYHPNSVALMPFLINQAVQDNFLPLAAQFLMISEGLSDSINTGMHNAVVCTEDAPFFSGENVSQEALAATYIGPLQYTALADICSVWPQGVLDEEFKQPVASDAPVLLLSGDSDPITPPEYAELAAVALTDYQHIIGSRQGHGQAMRGCMADIIGRFVSSASTSEESLDAACFERVFAMPFFLDFSGPSP